MLRSSVRRSGDVSQIWCDPILSLLSLFWTWGSCKQRLEPDGDNPATLERLSTRPLRASIKNIFRLYLYGALSRFGVGRLRHFGDSFNVEFPFSRHTPAYIRMEIYDPEHVEVPFLRFMRIFPNSKAVCKSISNARVSKVKGLRGLDVESRVLFSCVGALDYRTGLTYRRWPTLSDRGTQSVLTK